MVDTASGFALHPQLAADCHEVGDLGLCRLLLLDDRRYTWSILVPRRPGIVELHDLNEADRVALIEETTAVGQALKQGFGGDKVNVGALGNLVSQLHVHVVLRRVGDAAWPGPVWGHGRAQPYASAERQAVIRKLQKALGC